jgi:chromosome segregation ATPase
METSAVDHDRLFNLQLTIQRLEEELSLYRNGTTAEQMFDLMKEKEAEIAELKVVVADKDSKLRKLAKSSTEVITKFEDLQMANRNTLLQLAELAQSKEEDLKNHILITNEMNAKYEMCCKELESKDVTIAKLTEQARDADQFIQKLQGRCVELVNDKAQKFRHLDEQRQEMITKVQTYKVGIPRSNFVTRICSLNIQFACAGVDGFLSF